MRFDRRNTIRVESWYVMTRHHRPACLGYVARVDGEWIARTPDDEVVGTAESKAAAGWLLVSRLNAVAVEET